MTRPARNQGHNRALAAIVATAAVASIVVARPHTTPTVISPTPIASQSATLVVPCHSINGLPDSSCTPGATDPRVTQATISQTICVAGYTKTVRPPVQVTNQIKWERMHAYGSTDSVSNYELDHFVPLELAGAPADPKNLWPEKYAEPNGAHDKDRIENILHQRVCNGVITLQEAQREISTNWEAVR